MKEGKFTVELVDAHTKTPFKEFYDAQGKAYVEAEPDLEYLVQLKNEGNVRVLSHVYVDGASLGYDISVGTNQTICGLGLWNKSGDTHNYTALKFSLQPVSGAASVSHTPVIPHFGRVKVSFYEALGGKQVGKKNAWKNDRDGAEKYLNSTSATSFIGPSGEKKKAFKTDPGVYQTTATKLPKTWTTYECGEHLGDVTIQYCSVLGLIHKGILPSTPTNTTPQQTPGGGHGSKKKGRGVDAAAVGGTRLDFEDDEEEAGGGVEIVSSSSSGPARKKARTGEKKDEVIDLCNSDDEQI